MSRPQDVRRARQIHAQVLELLRFIDANPGCQGPDLPEAVTRGALRVAERLELIVWAGRDPWDEDGGWVLAGRGRAELGRLAN